MQAERGVRAAAQPTNGNGRRDFRIVGGSLQIEGLRQLVARVAPANVPVLILGETGTGKELVARALHSEGRRNGRFVALNCTAIPEGLVESELFGHVQGAFTGAARKRIGKFEQAAGGTLFLDEIGDMPLTTQAKVLRVLELGEFERVGASEGIQFSDARIVCATNQDLEEAISQRDFREDLLTRISTLIIRVPPLREHLEDVPQLVQHFLEAFNHANKKAISITDEALAKIVLLASTLKGNVRGLRALVDRAAVFAEENTIREGNAALEQRQPAHAIHAFTLPATTAARDAGQPAAGASPSTVITEALMRAAIRKQGPFKISFKQRPQKLALELASLIGADVSSLRVPIGKLKAILREERVEAIRECSASGMTLSKTARTLGCDTTGVKKLAGQSGITFHSKRTPQAPAELAEPDAASQ